MKIGEIASAIEQAAPLCLQESYDNSGLIVGSYDTEISSALITVDVTEDVMEEAERLGAGLIISHHPIIFHPIKRLIGSGHVQRIVERAIRNGIAIYASHTNLDAVHGGMSFALAERLELHEVKVLNPLNELREDGFGIVGNLPETIDPVAFLMFMKETLQLEVIRHSRICSESVRKVAICTGSGASLIETAASAGADIYIAADFKYNDFIDADDRLIVADIGHYESEYCAIDLLYDIITKKIPTFALHKSVSSRNPVKYLF